MADDEKKDSYGDFQGDTIDAYLKHLRDPDSDRTNDKYNEDIVYYEVSHETAEKMKVEGTETHCKAITGCMVPIAEQTTCTTVVPDVHRTHCHNLMTITSCCRKVSIC